MTEPKCFVRNDGTKEWRINGKYHRLDGPALEHCYGTNYWFIHGKQILKQNFPKAVIMFLLNCNKQTAEMIIGAFNDRA